MKIGAKTTERMSELLQNPKVQAYLAQQRHCQPEALVPEDLCCGALGNAEERTETEKSHIFGQSLSAGAAAAGTLLLLSPAGWIAGTAIGMASGLAGSMGYNAVAEYREDRSEAEEVKATNALLASGAPPRLIGQIAAVMRLSEKEQTDFENKHFDGVPLEKLVLEYVKNPASSDLPQKLFDPMADQELREAHDPSGKYAAYPTLADAYIAHGISDVEMIFAEDLEEVVATRRMSAARQPMLNAGQLRSLGQVLAAAQASAAGLPMASPTPMGAMPRGKGGFSLI
jgi:hypothetical protein